MFPLEQVVSGGPDHPEDHDEVPAAIPRPTHAPAGQADLFTVADARGDTDGDRAAVGDGDGGGDAAGGFVRGEGVLDLQIIGAGSAPETGLGAAGRGGSAGEEGVVDAAGLVLVGVGTDGLGVRAVRLFGQDLVGAGDLGEDRRGLRGAGDIGVVAACEGAVGASDFLGAGATRNTEDFVRRTHQKERYGVNDNAAFPEERRVLRFVGMWVIQSCGAGSDASLAVGAGSVFSTRTRWMLKSSGASAGMPARGLPLAP